MTRYARPRRLRSAVDKMSYLLRMDAGPRILPPLPAVMLLLAASLIAGCGGTDRTTSTDASTTTASAPGTTGVTSSPSTTSSTVSTIVDGDFRATDVVTGLRVPWEIRFLPDGRLLITERAGRIVVADVGTGEVTEVGTVAVRAQGEGGLMGLALDPDFPATPDIYVSYTHDQDGEAANRLSRFTLDGADTPQPALGAETVLLDGLPAGSNHNGSRVAWGPDGCLWMTTGDSGDGDLAQEMDSLAGKVLRMTRDGQPAPDNPFLDRAYPFSLIYTLGHRNPQGLAFQPTTNVAYVTEHGPNDNDEVNRLEAGGNYGWPDLRGKEGEPGFVDPLITWSPTIAPAGAVFLTDDRFGGSAGSFVLVTLKESDLRVLVAADMGDLTEEAVLFDDEFGRLRALAQGPDGALYVGTSNHDGRGDPGPEDDRIIRIEPIR